MTKEAAKEWLESIQCRIREEIEVVKKEHRVRSQREAALIIFRNCNIESDGYKAGLLSGTVANRSSKRRAIPSKYIKKIKFGTISSLFKEFNVALAELNSPTPESEMWRDYIEIAAFMDSTMEEYLDDYKGDMTLAMVAVLYGAYDACRSFLNNLENSHEVTLSKENAEKFKDALEKQWKGLISIKGENTPRFYVRESLAKKAILKIYESIDVRSAYEELFWNESSLYVYWDCQYRGRSLLVGHSLRQGELKISFS
ncbi:hypothetical protein BDW_02380 [Bdellovibrio bacteriovorus W]|nr:hypothetical protein BDW_02380 [Bdellovibrio bacteriovorus W]